MEDPRTSSSTIDRHRSTALTESWVALWNGDYDIAEQIISEDNRVHAAMFDGGDGSAVGGVSGMREIVTQMRSLMSDLSFTVDVGPVVDGDLIVVRWQATGHYGGGMPGAAAPAGTPVVFHGTDILRVAEGRIVEYWLNADSLALMTQLQVGAG
ncbi:ester cyclase [Nesterenkonia sp. E16_7]|uniref:ester cyclase n=1 Tax=unclassified Nesterenkonia TaxID=2629769 RepID=UPI001A936D5A|nr:MULTISPECIES: ester cyclase [unclassified Nesterenkonia]MBO0595903.1 ester cyclase [Nesterenkonia sp. E16_10]MBO0599498.1 ester cyclase [Nesterenkonia sp. E16_7]